MKKYMLVMIIPLFLSQSCYPPPGAIPLGRWDYKLFVNGVEMGTASFIKKAEKDYFINITEMEIRVGTIVNKTRQIITETREFKPIKFEVYSKIINKKDIQNINTIAIFKKDKIELDTGYSKATITIKKPFILEGSYFMDELIKSNFKTKTEIDSYIYDPTIEIDEPILVNVKILGRKNISINGKMQNLIHIVQSIDNLKNIDVYINDKGITQKAIIKMLNNKIELVIK